MQAHGLRHAALVILTATGALGESPHTMRPPLVFEENVGQTDARARYLARGGGFALFLTPDAAVLRLDEPRAGKRRVSPGGAAIRMRFDGASSTATLDAGPALAGVRNELIGTDRSRWRTGVPLHGRVRYRGLYPGIDLVFYGTEGRLEHDFILSRGADPAAVRLAFDGAGRLAVDASGDLLIGIGDRQVKLRRPRVYQRQRIVRARYRLLGRNRAGFDIGPYDRSEVLVIDPVLDYSTYFGFSGYERGGGVAADSAGNVYLAGSTTSASFPVIVGPYHSASCSSAAPCGLDVFVAKFDPAVSTLIYSTILGSSGSDDVTGIAVDSSGAAIVTGGGGNVANDWTYEFPIVNAAQPNPAAAFLFKLSPAGSSLVYSTYLGGSAQDYTSAVAVDAAGNAYVAGFGQSGDFVLANSPPLGAMVMSKSTNGGASWTDVSSGIHGTSASAIAIQPAAAGGRIFYGSYSAQVQISGDAGATWGARNFDIWTTSIAIDPGAPGTIYVGDLNAIQKSTDSGATYSVNNNGLGPQHPQNWTVALAIDPGATSTIYAGTWADGVYKSADAAASWTKSSTGLTSVNVQALAVDTGGGAVYAGTADSGVFASADGAAHWSAATTGLANSDVHALVVISAGTLLAGTSAGVFKTTDGGAHWTSASTGMGALEIDSLAVDPSATATIYAAGNGLFKSVDGGATWSALPLNAPGGLVAIAIDPTNTSTLYAIASTGFGIISKYDASGHLQYARPMNSYGYLYANAVALDAAGNPVVAGLTSSDALATPGAAHAALAGGTDAFVARLDAAGAITKFSYLGGSGFDSANGVGVDGAGNIYVAGTTQSADYPASSGALQTSLKGASAGFLARLDPALASVAYSTLLGGSGADEIDFLDVTQAGIAYAAGITTSSDFPTHQPLQASLGGGKDVSISKLDLRGSTPVLLFSTYFGGTGNENVGGMWTDGKGNLWLTGSTSSSDFPTAHAYQNSSGGGGDAYLLKIARPAPAAQITGAAVVPGNLVAGAKIELDGSASTDPEGGALSYAWSGPFPEGGGSATAVRPTVTLPFGASTVSLAVNNGESSSAPATMKVTVTDFQLALSQVDGIVLRSGHTATGTLAVTPVGGAFNAPLSLACTTSSPVLACSISPSTVTSAQAASATVTLSVTDAKVAWLAVLLLPGIGMLFSGARRRRPTLLLIVVAWPLTSSCSGCGSSKTYQVGLTVTGTSGSLQHTATASLKVQR